MSDELAFEEPRAAAIAEGLAPDEVARACELTAHLDRIPLLLSTGPRGTLITGDIAFVSSTARKTSASSAATVYLMSYEEANGFFACLILRGGKETAVFEHPPGTDDDLPRVTEVLGQRSPRTILVALGVPPALLGLDRDS